MLRFGGFKASLNFSSKSKRKGDFYEDIPIISSTKGAYRSNREEFYINGNLPDPPKSLSPSLVQLPPSSSRHVSAPPQPPPEVQLRPQKPKVLDLRSPQSQPGQNIRPSKSASDLNQPQPRLQPNTLIGKSTPDVSSDPRGTTSSNIRDSTDVARQQTIAKKQNDPKTDKKRLAEEKKREKQAAAEQAKQVKLAAQEEDKRKKLAAQEEAKRQKLAAQERAKQDKLAAQERAKQEKQAAQEAAKQEKLRKEREKAEAKLVKQNKGKGGNTARSAPVNAPVPPPPPPQPQLRANPLAQGRPAQYNSNTLESSISRTSGPPAYSYEDKHQAVKNERDTSGNTSFSKPIDNPVNSWDLISQHRQQINRAPVSGNNRPKQMVMDLQYNTGRPSGSSNEGRSEA